MEACGSAHYWARRRTELGMPVRRLPPKHVRRYVLGNKTDAADCAALLEAARNPKIRAVRIGLRTIATLVAEAASAIPVGPRLTHSDSTSGGHEPSAPS